MANQSVKPSLCLFYTLVILLCSAPFPQASEAQNLKQEALQLYQEQKYAEALPLFKQLVKQYPDNEHLRSKYGYSLYQIKQYQQAHKEFTHLLNYGKNKSLQRYAKKILQLIAEKTPPPSPNSEMLISPTRVEPSSQPNPDSVPALIQSINQQETLVGIVPYLTHESATMIAFNFIFGLQFMSQFQHLIPQESKRQRFALLDAELQSLLSKYSISQLSRANYQTGFQKIQPFGRVFLKDLAQLLETYEEKKGKSRSKIKQFKQLKLAKLTFQPRDEQTVLIRHVDQKLSWEARKIKGLWKLHLGGIQELKAGLE